MTFEKIREFYIKNNPSFLKDRVFSLTELENNVLKIVNQLGEDSYVEPYDNSFLGVFRFIIRNKTEYKLSDWLAIEDIEEEDSWFQEINELRKRLSSIGYKDLGKDI